jgi:hypothetical protein
MVATGDKDLEIAALETRVSDLAACVSELEGGHANGASMEGMLAQQVEQMLVGPTRAEPLYHKNHSGLEEISRIRKFVDRPTGWAFAA